MNPQWITNRLPDTSGTVLLRLSGMGFKIAEGYCRDNQWYWPGGQRIFRTVLGWMTLEDAAALLDGPSNKALAESLKRKEPYDSKRICR